MVFFILIALATAILTLTLDRALQKEKLPKKIRWSITVAIPTLTLALYFYLGNLIFV